MAEIRGEYSSFGARLAELPKLLRRQRKLEKQLHDKHGSLVKQEKETRSEMDKLLLAAGLAQGQGVSCLGFDVVHRERAGNVSINQDKAVEQLVALGVDRAAVLKVFADSEERGERAKWCEVEVPKGATVRKAAA